MSEAVLLQTSRLIAAGLLLAGLSFAQQAAQESVQPTLRVQTNLVVVPFQVRRGSRSVSDLKRSDIVLLEDGVPRAFTGFEAPQNNDAQFPSNRPPGRSCIAGRKHRFAPPVDRASTHPERRFYRMPRCGRCLKVVSAQGGGFGNAFSRSNHTHQDVWPPRIHKSTRKAAQNDAPHRQFQRHCI